MNMARRSPIIRDFTKGSITGQLLRFSGPVMLSNLLQIVYNMVDMAIVGRFVGSAGLTAVAGGGDIMNIGTTIGMGFGAAGQIMISQHIGRGSKDGIRKTVGTMMVFLGLLALATSITGLFAIDALLVVLNIPEEAFAGTKAYSTVCFTGMFFIFGYNMCAAVLRGMGDSKRPLVFIAIAAVLNLVLDLVFVVGLGLGPWGAALATVIGQGISYIVSLSYLYRHRDALGLDFSLKGFYLDIPTLGHLVKLGLPLTLQHGVVVFSKLFVNSYIYSYGLVMATVNAIGRKVGFVASVVTMALSSASTSMIGQNFGAGKPRRIKRTVAVSTALGLVFTAALSAVMILFPEQIFGLFDNNPQVLESSHVYVLIAVLTFNAFSLRGAMMAFVSGVGNSMLAFCIGIFDGIVGRIFLAIFLGKTLNMGILGFWLGDVFSSYIPFLIGGAYFASGVWKRRKLAISD